MKEYIYRVNQKLIEKYPTIWNTKIVWMLAISIIFHIIFYVIGLLSLSNPESLHEHRAIDVFFDNGSVFFNIVISLLLIVVWLTQLFKNNAFKNFYPITKGALFKQFIYYFIIVFSCTSFYFSFLLGAKTFIHTKYDNSRMAKEISIANKAAIFFSHSLSTYSLDKKRFPTPFDTLYCEKRSSQISYKKPYLSQFEFDYQYYNLYRIERSVNDRYDKSLGGYVYKRTIEDTIDVYFYKDKVIDVSEHLSTTFPSYYNYSSLFYSNNNYDDYDYVTLDLYNDYTDYYENYGYSDDRILYSKNSKKLLDESSPEDIKKLLSDFLFIANLHKIRNNLSADEWFTMVYHPSNFVVKSFIRNEVPTFIDRAETEKTLSEQYFSDNLTKYYLDSESLKNTLENIDHIKDMSTFEGRIHLFIWISFILSCFIFMFRVTNMRILIFSIITSGVLTLIISLLTALFAYITNFSGNSVSYFISYTAFIVGTIILLIPLFYANKFRKFIVGICLNISIAGIIPYAFLIIGIITMHQSDHCGLKRSLNPDLNWSDCFILLDYLDIYTSYLLFAIGLVFMYFYANTIKKWRALPEG